MLHVYKRLHVRHIAAVEAVSVIQALQKLPHTETEQTALVVCTVFIKIHIYGRAAEALLEAYLPGMH